MQVLPPENGDVPAHLKAPDTYRKSSFVGDQKPDSVPFDSEQSTTIYSVCPGSTSKLLQPETDEVFGTSGPSETYRISSSGAASTTVKASPPSDVMKVLPAENVDALPAPKPADIYRKSSSNQTSATTAPGTIYAIPPSFAPTNNNSQSTVRELFNNNRSTSGFPGNGFPAEDFPTTTASCVKDNIMYDEIPVDDSSSVSSIMSDIPAAGSSATTSGRLWEISRIVVML